MNTPHNFGRHGEVIIIPADKIPAGAKLVAESNEATKHAKDNKHWCGK